MKQKIRFFITILLTVFSALSADVDSGDYGSEKMEDISEQSSPFKIELRTDVFGPAKTTTKGYLHKKNLHYNESQADISAVCYHDPEYNEAVSVQLGYNITQLYWKNIPTFDQKTFGNVQVGVGFFTERLCGWAWQVYTSLNMDNKYPGLNNYTTYDLLLWGKYTWREDINVHVGFLGWTGLKIDKVLPILGFDWTFWDKWQLNAIFPINASLVYNFNDRLSATLAGRFLWNRHRIEKDAYLSEGIWEYRNTGLELGVNYLFRNSFMINAHAGYASGGYVNLSTKNYRHTKKYRFEGSPYAGGEASFSF